MMKITSETLKSSKPFKLWDLAVYAAVAVIICVLFVSFCAVGKSKPENIEVRQNGVLLMSCDFDGNAQIFAPALIEQSADGDSISFKIYTDENRSGYNVLTVSVNERSARVTDSDCSARKDCVHTRAITISGAVIICAPHALEIKATSSSTDQPSIG